MCLPLSTNNLGGRYSHFGEKSNAIRIQNGTLSSKPHLRLCETMESLKEYLVFYSCVVLHMAICRKKHISLVHYPQKTGNAPKTHKISVNLTCHGGYPSSFTTGPNNTNNSGSPITLSLTSASTNSTEISPATTFPLCAISASVFVKSTRESRPSSADRRRICKAGLEGEMGGGRCGTRSSKEGRGRPK